MLRMTYIFEPIYRLRKTLLSIQNNPILQLPAMVHNHQEQPTSRGSGHSGIPVPVITLRHTGLCSGGPPPETAMEIPPPWMVIWVPPRPAMVNGETSVIPNTVRPGNRENPVIPNPARVANRETPVAPNTAQNDTREAAPPSYTKQVEQGATGALRIERVSTDDDPLSELGTGMQGNQELGGDSTSSGDIAMRETVVTEGNTTVPQNVRIALDREIVETIRGIAQEQQSLRTELTQEQRNLRSEIQSARQEQRNLWIEIQGAHQDTAELQATAKTHESRLGLLFKRIGDVIDDQCHELAFFTFFSPYFS